MHLDAIWDRARADLAITTKQGRSDLLLWEHTTRITRSAQQIARLPMVQAAEPDETAIVAASLYHDAGWAVRWQAGEIEHTEVLLGPTTDANREQAASMLERRVADLLPSKSLHRASRAVRSLTRGGGDSIEGQVVAEADNLDEFGPLSLWLAIRRGMLEGKGVQAVIDMWRRKAEYKFWTARLNDSFRFQPVLELARERLEKSERFVEELEEQHLGRDLPVSDNACSADRTPKPTRR